MNVLKGRELTKTEEDLISAVLQANPVLGKWFEVLAHNIAVELAYCPVDFTEEPTVFERKRLVLRGQLDLLDTLGSTYHAVTQSNQE